MYLLDQLTSRQDDGMADIRALIAAREWVEVNSHHFANLPNASSFVFCGVVYIDFDNLSHSQVMQVVMAFGRPWTREPNGGRINYEHIVSTQIRIRCHAGEPPPNCRIEYEEVLVPARTERRAKIMCKPVNQSIPDETPKLTDTEPSLADEIPFLV